MTIYYFQIPAQKYLKQAFLVPDLLRIFISAPNFAIRQIRGCWFQYNNSILNSSPKILKSSIFGSNFKDFYFSTKLCINTNLRALISIMTMFFSKLLSKTHKQGIFYPRFKDFYFSTNLWFKKNSRAISNMTILFPNFSLKIPK